MSSLLQVIASLPVPFNMVVLIVLIGCVAGVLSTFAKEMRKYLCHRGEIELKREMIDRGMGSQEIEQVMRASKSEEIPPKYAQHVR